MWDIIVLGQIPGTQIQISFESWALFSIGLIAGFSAYIVLRFARHSHIITVLRVRHILQTAAYAQWLTTRRFIRV